MSEPLPHEVTIAGQNVLLFLREENPLVEEESEYADFLATLGGEMANFAPGRLKEFYLGRSLVRAAIHEILGVDPGWIRTGADRRPELPSGVAASLSHTHLHGHRVAVVAAARTNDKRIGVDLEPCFTDLQAEKLQERFAGYFHSDTTALGAVNMTELFTVYETCVKILSQKNRGIVSPSHLKLENRTSDSWVVTHPESGTHLEGVTLKFRDARLSIGIG